ncbi:MAG: hypothetical protein HFJ12_01105 [Bacilli bacterium]|nr:hypothetical protein [Bacilli bacterium]
MDLLMILVTLGTQDKDFSRLLKAIDREIKKGNIKEKVIVQAGYTKYHSDNMEIFDLIEPEKLHNLVKKCNLLITHGGVGSILDGLKSGKKVIAASRLKKYREHTNDHQKQIVKKFADEGYLLELRDMQKLDKMLERAENFKPKKFQSNTNQFIKGIDDYIKEDNHTSWFNRFRFLCSNGYIGFILNIINLFLFCILFGKINVYYNILISYFVTFLLSLLFNVLIDVEYKHNWKHFWIIRGMILILDLDLMYLFKNIIQYHLIYSKFIINFIIIILSYIVIKFCFQNKNKK